VFGVHDSRAQQEMLDNAFFRDCVNYDHNTSFISTIKNEAVFAVHTLILAELDLSLNPIRIQDLNEIDLDYNLSLGHPVRFNDEIYTYGICLLNKWLYNKEISNSKYGVQDCSKMIYSNSEDNTDYHFKLLEFNKNLNWFIASYKSGTLAFELDESCDVLAKCLENPLLSNLPNNPYIGYYIHQSLVNKTIKELPKHYNLVKLLKSKFKKEQFTRSVINIGLN
jgi:hypothetical protein